MTSPEPTPTIYTAPLGHWSNCNAVRGDGPPCSCDFDARLNNAINAAAYKRDEERRSHTWQPYARGWKFCSHCGVVEQCE